ncbi:hypothetical protein [Micavibrio aeruginosavorus]|uniref:hypothetical protein n=1 Tax=Micavibrio aeruginosavorus TaxID=349221 RepID=UPI003F4AADF9
MKFRSPWISLRSKWHDVAYTIASPMGRAEICLADAVKALVQFEAEDTQDALIDITQNYLTIEKSTPDQAFGLTEAMMNLCETYGNLFGKCKEYQLLSTLRDHSPDQVSRLWLQINSRMTQVDREARQERRDSKTDDPVLFSAWIETMTQIQDIMRDQGMKGLFADFNPPQMKGIPTAASLPGRMSPKDVAIFCMRYRFFAGPQADLPNTPYL